MKRVVAIDVAEPFVLDLRFNDEVSRRVDLRDELWGPVFGPLREPVIFVSATLDPVLGTVVWPTGADFSPEFLYYGNEEFHPSDDGEGSGVTKGRIVPVPGAPVR